MCVSCLDPLDSLLCGLRHIVGTGEVFVVDHGQANHRLLPNFKLLVQSTLLKLKRYYEFMVNVIVHASFFKNDLKS